MLTIIIAAVIVFGLMIFWWIAQGFVTGLDYSVMWIFIIIFTELMLEERDRQREIAKRRQQQQSVNMSKKE